jgi:hypothetical protein
VLFRSTMNMAIRPCDAGSTGRGLSSNRVHMPVRQWIGRCQDGLGSLRANRGMIPGPKWRM